MGILEDLRERYQLERGYKVRSQADQELASRLVAELQRRDAPVAAARILLEMEGHVSVDDIHGPPWAQARPDLKFLTTMMDLNSAYNHEYESWDHVDRGRSPGELSLHAKGVIWDLSDSFATVLVPVDKVATMEGNQWGWGHVRALHQAIMNGSGARAGRVWTPTWPPRIVLEPPSGRLYRISQEDVRQSQEFDENGELQYQLEMDSPWDDDDAGSYHVQLINGNHRFLAALMAGNTHVPVQVGPNYREDVRDDEWILRR
jgi:hypothetical protein